MMANKNEARTMTEHISCDSKRKFNSRICNSNQKLKKKNYRTCRKDYSCNPITCIYENIKYLKSATDTSVTECDQIITVINNILTKMIMIITSTASINCHSIKVRDCYIVKVRVL